MADISKVRMLNGTEYNYKDAKARSDIEGLKADLQSLGMTADIKAALLTCINHVAWSDDNGDNCYNALKTALNYISIAPLYSFDKIGYEIGALSINNVYETPGDLSTPADYKLVNNNDNLNTRARMVGLIPAKKGTVLTAKSGYEIVVYQFAEIGFRSSGRYADDTRNSHGNYYCLDSVVQAPAWGTSYIVANDNCNYIRVAFRKISHDAWTQDEMTNFYGTVFTAKLCPEFRYFDVAEYVGGKTFIGGDIVIAGTTDRYVKEQTNSARAIMRYVPVTKGIFKSADANKYQISVYQISSIGAFIRDTSNPHDNGYPSWADQYTIHLDGVTAVCMSFKKLDGTDFTSDELANMYGTVFTYEVR